MRIKTFRSIRRSCEYRVKRGKVSKEGGEEAILCDREARSRGGECIVKSLDRS